MLTLHKPSIKSLVLLHPGVLLHVFVQA